MLGCSIFARYYALDKYFIFKEKNNQVLLKIYDLSHKSISTKIVKTEDLPQEGTPLQNSELKERIILLLHSGYRPDPTVSKNFLSPQEQKNQTQQEESLVQIVGKVMRSLRLQSILEQDYPKEFLCPITKFLMVNPVSDNHGHTFEDTAIKQEMSHTNTCPLNQELITSLTINLNLKETIEKFKENAQVPIIDNSIIEKPNLAKSFIQNGKVFEEEEIYDEALSSYTKALKYTKNVDNYLLIPHLLEKMNQLHVAAVCYLHLAEQEYSKSLETQDSKQALSYLEKAKQLHSCPSILKVLAQAYEHSGESAKANALHQQIEELYSNQQSEEAYQYYKQRITLHPTSISLYEKLICVCSNRSLQAYFYLKGASELLAIGNRGEAYEFFKKSYSTMIEAPFISHLPYLEFLSEQNKIEELKIKCFELANHYKEQNNIVEMIRCYKILLSSTAFSGYHSVQEICYSELISAYQILNKPDLIIEIHIRWVNALIKEKRWQKAEEIALQALACAQDHLGILEQLEMIYTVWQEHKLNSLWLQLGKNYENRGDLVTATAVYKKAYARFQEPNNFFTIISLLQRQENISEAVTYCYKGSKSFLFVGEHDLFEKCMQVIDAIDPTLAFLPLKKKKAIQYYKHSHSLRKEHENCSVKVNDLVSKNLALEFDKAELNVKVTRLEQELVKENVRSNKPTDTRVAKVNEELKCTELMITNHSLSYYTLPNGNFITCENKSSLRYYDGSSGTLLSTLNFSNYKQKVYTVQNLNMVSENVLCFSLYIEPSREEKSDAHLELQELIIWDLESLTIKTLFGPNVPSSYLHKILPLVNNCYALLDRDNITIINSENTIQERLCAPYSASHKVIPTSYPIQALPTPYGLAFQEKDGFKIWDLEKKSITNHYPNCYLFGKIIERHVFEKIKRENEGNDFFGRVNENMYVNKNMCLVLEVPNGLDYKSSTIKLFDFNTKEFTLVGPLQDSHMLSSKTNNWCLSHGLLMTHVQCSLLAYDLKNFQTHRLPSHQVQLQEDILIYHTYSMPLQLKGGVYKTELVYWDLKERKVVSTLKLPEQDRFTFLDDDLFAFIDCPEKKEYQIWDLREKRCIKSIKEHSSLNINTFSYYGNILKVGLGSYGSETYKFWKIERNKS